VALFSWPAVCVVLFLLLPLEAAAIWSLLGGYLLLPSGATFDVALLPPLDKYSIPATTTILLCWMKGTQAPPPSRTSLIYFLAAVFVLSPLVTSIDNSYELLVVDRSIPGFYPLDGAKMALHNLITLAPFIVGMRFLSSDKSRALLLKSLLIAALLYSVPMLWEIRFSPQLHRLVYGFTSTSFNQTVRGGGYRPVVFLFTGLEVALFASMAFIGALVAIRAKWRALRLPTGAVAAFLGVMLVLCKTMGAFIYAGVAAPLVLFTRPRVWVNVACAIVLIVCAYPALRSADIVPVHRIAELATTISPERSSSFLTRVDNEDKLLAKANQKPLGGWGTWGRNRIYDKESGGDVTITDGEWIILYSGFGWLGYLSMFGLFALSAIRARTAVSGPPTQPVIILAGLCLLFGMNILDLVPNANLTPLTFLMAGSIAGALPARAARRSRGTSKPQPEMVAVAS